MNLIHVALFIYSARCMDIQFQIKSFQMKLVTNKKENNLGLLNLRAKMNSTEVTNQMVFRHSERNETAVEAYCRSQVPDKKKIDAVLSDMMNQLTLVFVKVNQFINSEVAKVSRKFLDADVVRRALETRFKVSHRKRRLIFDEIFNNMSTNYRNVYNSTTEGVFRAGEESICHKVVSRQLWNLLEYSLLALRKAVRSSMSEYLKEQSISSESALGKKVNKLIATEISQIRAKQLNMLCDKFQLCNGTSLQEFIWLV